MLRIECWIRRSRRVLLEFVEMGARCPALVGMNTTRSEGPATWRVLGGMKARGVKTSVTMHVINKVTSLPCTTLRPLYAGAECHCTAQLLRSIRVLHFVHRNAQHSQATLHTPLDQRFDLFDGRAGGVWTSCGRRGGRQLCLELHRTDRVGHKVVEGLRHDRRSGVGTVTTLGDDTEHDVLRVADRSKAHEQGVRFLLVAITGGAGLAGDGKR